MNSQCLIILTTLLGTSFAGFLRSSAPHPDFRNFGGNLDEYSYGYGGYGPPPTPPEFFHGDFVPLGATKYSSPVVYDDPAAWQPIPGPLPLAPPPEPVHVKVHNHGKAPIVLKTPGQPQYGAPVPLAPAPLPLAAAPLVDPAHDHHYDAHAYAKEHGFSSIDIQPSLSYGYSYKLVPTYNIHASGEVVPAAGHAAAPVPLPLAAPVPHYAYGAPHYAKYAHGGPIVPPGAVDFHHHH